MSIEVDEKQFVSSYLELISLSENRNSSFFNDVGNYGSLTSLGPSLPSITGQFPSSSTSSNIKKVKLSFKSIKPPFKFSTELNDVPESETIFNVKNLLIDSLELAVKPQDIKFLIKGKVIQDSVVLSALDSYGFMCMVTQSTVTTSPAPEATSDPEPVLSPTPMDIDTNVSEGSWNKIFNILKEDIGEEKASLFLTKFKGSI